MVLKANQLYFDELIEFGPETGKITFNDKRMSLVSVEAEGLLRRDLINTLGMERAKGFLMRYGWACGMKDGETIAEMYEWDNMTELMLAGPVLHTLLGVVIAEPDQIEIGDNYLHFSGTWKNSYEALEHIEHYGNSESTSCWTLVGYASGYLTKTFGKDVLVYETECVGRGDSTCRFVAQTLESFDRQDQAKSMMRYYKAESIATELNRAQKELQEINQNIIESDKVHQRLTNQLVEDKELHETITFVANTLNKSIVIDYYNNIIESAFVKGHDQISYQNWTDKFIYKEEKQNNIRTYPIRANNINLGRLVVISREKATKRDELIINRALGIFTVQMYHQWKITQSLWQKKEDFFEEMLSNHDIEFFEKFSHVFNFHPNDLNRILAIKVEPSDTYKEIMLYLQLNEFMENRDYFYNKNHVIIILSDNDAKDPSNFTDKILHELKKEFPIAKLYLGIGRNAVDLQSLQESYQDANSISQFILLTNPSGNLTVTYEDMGPVMMLLKGTNQNELVRFYKKTIGELIKYDELTDTDYVLTLKSYLNFNGNLQQTADELHLSIAGLRYRMERIENLCDIDLKTGDGRFKCQLAIQIYFAVSVCENKVVPQKR